jgi:hypothetical protein
MKSCTELDGQIDYAHDVHLLSEKTHEVLHADANHLRQKLYRFRQSILGDED